MGLIDNIKGEVKKAGSNRGKFIYFKENEKVRVRFLCDMEEGMEVTFHDSFEKSVNVPCQEIFGRDCKYCEDDSLRTRNQYVWSVWNYDRKEVQLFMFAVNNCTPIPALVAMYENYGTLTDRDFVITRTGKGQGTTYSVVPMDKVKFRNDKAKPFSEKAILKMLDKAFPSDDTSGDDDDEYEEENKKKRQSSKKNKDSEYASLDEDELPEGLKGDDWDDDDEDDNDEDYNSMTEKELYKLCKEYGIEAKPKKNKKYYINLLEEYKSAEDDWDDDDDWDDED